MQAVIAPRSPGKPGIGRMIGSVSAARAYQDFVVGSRSWSRLLAQELIGDWLSPLPGAAGLLARRQLWRFLFEECGKGTVFGRSVTLRHALKMRLGANVMIDDDCVLDAGGAAHGAFRIEDGVLISRSTRLVAHRGELWLGPRVNIGVGCSILIDGGLRVGADTMFAAHCYIGGGKYDVDQPIELPMSQRKLPGSVPTVIEDDCWIGAGAIVLSGVTVGRGSVIGAGALVTRNIPPYSVALGQPARVTRVRRHAPAPRLEPAGLANAEVPRRSLQVLPGR